VKTVADISKTPLRPDASAKQAFFRTAAARWPEDRRCWLSRGGETGLTVKSRERFQSNHESTRMNPNFGNSFTKGNEENKVSVLRTSLLPSLTSVQKNSSCELVSIRAYALFGIV
jgi:hypothetical protein